MEHAGVDLVQMMDLVLSFLLHFKSEHLLEKDMVMKSSAVRI